MSSKSKSSSGPEEFAMAAADICKALTVNPPLDPKIGEEALSKEIVALLPDIKEGDDLAVATWVTLKKLGWKPEVKKSAAQVASKPAAKAKVAAPPANKEKAVKVEKDKAPKYTRNQAVVEAITKSKMSIADLAAKADKLFVEKGGTSNAKQSEHLVRCVLPILELVNFAAVEGGQVKKV